MITKNMKKRKIIFGILAIIWMTIIFSYSARTGIESTEDSYDVGYMVGRVVVPAFETWTPDEQLSFAEAVDHPIRKTAHFLEYMLLGVLVTGACDDVRRKKCYRILVPWLISTLYAASDEIHQLYVPGRSGQFSDVLLDSAGVFAGVLISLVVVHIYNRRVRRKLLTTSHI